MTGSARDVDRALLIGNSRWHWAQRQGNTVRIEHGPPDPGRIGTDPPVWAAVGPVPEPLMAHQDLRIRLGGCALASGSSLVGGGPLSGLGWPGVAVGNSSTVPGGILVDAGTVLSLTRVTADGCFGGGQLIPGYRLQLQAMADGTLGLPSTPEDLDNDALQEVFPQQTVAAMPARCSGGDVGLPRLSSRPKACCFCGGRCPVEASFPGQRSCCSWRVIFSCNGLLSLGLLGSAP